MRRGAKLAIVITGFCAAAGVVSNLRAQDREVEKPASGTKDGGVPDGGVPDGGVTKARPRQRLWMHGDEDVARALLPKLLRWAAPTGQTTVFDLACRAIAVKRDDRELIGETPLPAGKGGTWWGISFSTEVQVTGPNFRSRSGRNRGGLSSLERVELALSRVTRDAAWYGMDHPLIFRSIEACQVYRQKHRVSRGDLNHWPTFR